MGGQFPCGGAEKVTLDVGEALVQRGYRVIVFCRQFRQQLMPEDCSLEVIEYRQKLKEESTAHFFIQQIKAQHIRVLTYVIVLNPPFAQLIRRETGVKIVVAHHSYPFWEVINKFNMNEWLRRGNLLQRLKWTFYYRPRFALHTYERKYYPRYRNTIEVADAFIVLCEEYKDAYCKTFSLAKDEQEKICVIPNYLLPEDHPRLEKEKVVLFMGRLTRGDKRVDRLLDIWAMVEKDFPDWKLLIVGDGPEEENLRQQARRLRLQHVSFEGRHTDTKAYYDRAAVLCLTSSFEGWPMVIMEAQANGVVPIAFNCCAGVEHLLAGDESGLLVPPFDLAEYARQLVAIMNDAPRRARIQTEVLKKRYPLTTTCEGYDTLFNSLINSLIG